MPQIMDAYETQASTTPSHTSTYYGAFPTANGVSPSDYVNEGAPPWIGGVAVAAVFGCCILALVIYFCCYKMTKCCRRNSKLTESQLRTSTTRRSALGFDSTARLQHNSKGYPATRRYVKHVDPNMHMHAPANSHYPGGYYKRARHMADDNGLWLEEWRKCLEYDMRLKVAAAEIVGIYPLPASIAASKLLTVPQTAYSAQEATPELEPGIGRGSGSRYTYF